ncbi:PocR ligand-binding domain-containing protein [Candidatus Ozemobacteraceae bacterium]|nr:PocR ligand-binding domain-containing protein [Candidatus Ozemobacteraceae bacterium]
MGIANIEANLRQYGANADEITFEQLFRIEDIQTFQDLFAAATGVASLIARPDGTPITKPSNFCRLCRDIIRKTDVGCRNCYASDAAIGNFHPDGLAIQPCLSGGLWDAGCRITVAGRHIATWLIGQVRNEAQTEDGMRRYAREIGANEDEVVRAFLEVPVMSLQKLEQLTRMLYTLANQLSLIAYQNINLSRIISAREKTEQSLREQEERLRMIGNSIPSGMLYEAEAMPDGHVNLLYISEGVKALHGCTPEQAIADAGFIYRTVHPDDIGEFRRQELAAIQSNGIFDIEFRARTPEGPWRWRHIRSNSHLLPDGRRVWVGIETDINARKAAEESSRLLEAKLHQASKLEALGQLAGGIAHDLNNMLSPILGYGLLIKDKLPDTEVGIRQDLGLIIDAAERSSKLVRQLLIFARKQSIEIKSVDFNESIIAFEPMLRRMLRENIVVSFHLSPDVGAILGDPGQLQQILINLAVNAQDAMPQGGRLIIETNRVQLDDAFLRLHGGEIAGPHAVLSVSDTGIGMDRETQQKIYDPFFTTKGPGKGTGLGLATVYAIVKRHSGYIHVYSEPGRGTTFRLYFPLTDLPLEALQVQPVAVSNKGGETVLVVEDQDIVRTMVCEILMRSGYDVLAASSGEEALQLFSDAKHDIKLLLSDVIMTGMNGPELYQRMSGKHPGMKGLFMSGYSSEILNHEGVLRGICQIIQKPFAPRDLLRQLREILDRANEAGSSSLT